MTRQTECTFYNYANEVFLQGELPVTLITSKGDRLYVSVNGGPSKTFNSEHTVVPGTGYAIVHVQTRPNKNDLDCKSNSGIHKVYAAGDLNIINVKYVLYEPNDEPTYLYDGRMNLEGDEEGCGYSVSNEERCKSVYFGMWKHGDRHGQGVSFLFRKQAFSTFYIGNWKNDAREGIGISYRMNPKRRFMGHWKNGKRHGRGLVSYPNGNVYVGEWHEGKRDGKFTHYSRDGHTTTSY